MSKLTEWAKIGLVLLLISAWDDPCKVTVTADVEDVIEGWADSFGEELWQLSLTVTNLTGIKKLYKDHKVIVQKRGGKQLLDEIVDNVATMMKYKMDAIKCIMQTVEKQAAEFNVEDRIQNYTYYSSKCSVIEGEKLDPDSEKCRNEVLYDQMSLSPMRKYFNVPVNINHSAVHVPTNLYDRAPRVLDAIQWSEALDEVFLKNYESDPALQWQYFASSLGFLRNFPAMEWIEDPDQVDCRMRPWYIEAATCSKDVVILMDTTGSMRGMRLNIAKLTVKNILDTLSNNDFVNVFNFSDTIQEMVPCFEDMLVQASPENVNALKFAVNASAVEGHANFSVAFTKAFELLAKYREIRGCGENSTGEIQCNQAIMLVTDGVPHNITEVFEEFNWFENGTQIPVRIFSFLIGREVFQVREIQLVACLNRGYYKHVHTLNEVREGVFTYVPVLSRPLVLQGDVHPVTWSSIYSDTTDPTLDEWLFDVMEHDDQELRLYKFHRNSKLYFSQSQADRKYVKKLKKEPEELTGTIREREYHLMITVSIPAFDRKTRTENYTNTADLLGVIGTDILVDHIHQLTLPYKTGVNGYAFIVTNNGHLILHPDLRPVSQFELKDNFNSVDLTEVEILNDESGYREPSPEILQLREAMAHHEEGEMLDLETKSHYDEMRRVVVEKRDYFYAPLKGTPFTLGLSLPHNYGFHETKVRKDEVKFTRWHWPLLSFFQGYDWKIRPDWVYCKYHFEIKDKQSFDSPEKELRHFLEKMVSPDWHWRPQYDPDDSMESLKYTFEQDADNETEFINCNRKPVDIDEYYCDRDLVGLLLLDAKVTNGGFNETWKYKNDVERDLLDRYNATLRFISTQSGLTRWQYMLESDERAYRRTEFGNLHKLAIDEPWYKAAVLQHQIDPQSFVYSLAFDRIGVLEEDAFVTASYAVFTKEQEKEVPVSVLGLQFRQSSLATQFFEHTSRCADCPERCDVEELDCYVLDSGGYVIISENLNDTGVFFGQVDGSVMEAMVTEKIYSRIVVHDYQALCFEQIIKEKAAGVSLFTPLQQIHWFIQWLLGELTWLFVRTNLQQLWQLWPSASAYKTNLKEFSKDEYIEYYDSVEDIKEEEVTPANLTGTPGDVEEVAEYETINHPCDQQIELYSLNHKELKKLKKDGFQVSMQNCSRPFHIRPIPHSNLLLLVVDALYGSCDYSLSTDPVEVSVNDTYFACEKIYLNNLTRRKLAGCFTQHPEEEYIRECGDKGSQSHVSLVSLLIGALLFVANFVHHT